MNATRLLITAALLLPPCALAQKPAPNNIPAAPVPTPMIYGKHAFISYQFAETAYSAFSGEPQRDYNEFYAAMKAWGRYDLVGDPKDADLVYTIHLNPALGTMNVIVTSPNGASLWGFRTDLPVAGRQKTIDQGYTDSITKIMGYIKQLVETNTPPAKP